MRLKLGSRIKHIKTRTEYTVIGLGKCKVGSDWKECATYENRKREQFTRERDDFQGFVILT